MRYHEIISPETKRIRWFHRTTEDRVALIMRDNNLTESGCWAFEVYGCRPIFLSKSPDIGYKDHASVLFEVSALGLALVADLPSLVDAGAYYDIDDCCMWFEQDDGEMSFTNLIDPHSQETRKAISLTKTAACLTDIPPNHLLLVRKR